MTPEEEHFQTYTEDGQPSALVARSDVHRLGLLHRSVHIFVWNTADELLVTQRSADKDICPAYWDLLRPNTKNQVKPDSNQHSGVYARNLVSIRSALGKA